jgi:hypothetical protein
LFSDRNRYPAASPTVWTVAIVAVSEPYPRPRAEAVGAARAAHEQRRGAAREVVAERGGQAGERGAGRARKRHHRQGVAGEALPAQDHVPPDNRRQDRDDRPGLERVDHERIRREGVEVVDRVERDRGVHRS